MYNKWEDNYTGDDRISPSPVGDMNVIIWTNFYFRSVKRLIAFVDNMYDVFFGNKDNELYFVDEHYNDHGEFFQSMVFVEKMANYIVSETGQYKDAFMNYLKGSYALVKRDDIFQNVVNYCSGFDMSLDFTLSVKENVRQFLFNKTT